MATQTAAPREKLSQVYYTICPVKVASHVAAHQGFFAQAFARDGVAFTHISALPASHWSVHYTHDHPSFFRDGGNIPPLWTRARGADTVLVGLSFSQRRQSILVAKEAAITSIRDLRGKREALPQREDAIDFYRAMAHRGFLVALQVHGMNATDVEFVDIPATKAMAAQEGCGSVWSAKHDRTAAYGAEVAALLAGQVDAIYQSGGRVGAVLATGAVRAIYDLHTHPELFVRVSITVSGELARNYPELVVSYLEATLRGAAWARQHRDATISILARETFATEESIRASFPPDLHTTLAPELSEEGLTALEMQQQFLLEHGYMAREVAIRTWADASFLEAAKARLGASKV